MNEKFKNLPSILNFPDDDRKRLVWAFGPLYKNGSMASDMPIVEVLLVGIDDINRKEVLSSDYKILRVGLSQLDSVRVGNIFIGKKRIERNWKKFMGYKEGVDFNFDFDATEPETIHFGAKRDDGNYYIDSDIFSFSVITDNKADKARFLNTKFAKLTTEDGTTVLIPSLEVLTNMLVPKEQEIRNKLIMLPMGDIVSGYLEKYRCDTTANRYIIQMKMRKDPSNMIFLAYLAMNSVSQTRLSKIRNSVVIGNPLDAKYPEVLPYHPRNLHIITDGLWINKNTFLCFRVEGMTPPEDYLFTEVRKIPKEREVPDEDPPDNTPRPPEREYDEDDLDIVEDENPNGQNHRYNIHSEIDVEDMSYLFNEENIETDGGSSVHFVDPEDKEKEPIQLSSGEERQSKDSEDTAKLVQKEDLISNSKERVENSDIFRKTIWSLEYIKKNPKSLLLDYAYIHEDGESRGEGSLCSFLYPETKYKKEGVWAYKVHKKKDKKFVPRAALIIKVSLSDGMYAYILEIERKTKSEAYSGLIFNTLSGNLTQRDIKDLLVEIARNKGKYHIFQNGKKKKISLESVPSYEIYYHREDEDEKKLYIKVFEHLFKNGAGTTFFLNS